MQLSQPTLLPSKVHYSILHYWLKKFNLSHDWWQRMKTYTFTLNELHVFISQYIPPPVALQQIWLTTIWRREGEPCLLYLLRCIIEWEDAICHREYNISTSMLLEQMKECEKLLQETKTFSEMSGVGHDITIFSVQAIKESIISLKLIWCKLVGVRYCNGYTHLVQDGVALRYNNQPCNIERNGRTELQCQYNSFTFAKNRFNVKNVSNQHCKEIYKEYIPNKHMLSEKIYNVKDVSELINRNHKTTFVSLPSKEKNKYTRYSQEKMLNASVKYGNLCFEHENYCKQGMLEVIRARWSRRIFFILELADGLRCTAVAFGDCLLHLLYLGECYKALVYKVDERKEKYLLCICSVLTSTHRANHYTSTKAPIHHFELNTKANEMRTSKLLQTSFANYLLPCESTNSERTVDNLQEEVCLIDNHSKTNYKIENDNESDVNNINNTNYFYDTDSDGRVIADHNWANKFENQQDMMLKSNIKVAKCSINKLVEVLAPQIFNEIEAKTLTLLSIAHTLYCSIHFKSTKWQHQAHKKCSWWQALHLLITGESRSGRSTLLRTIQNIFDRDAVSIGTTVIHHHKSFNSNCKRANGSNLSTSTIETILPEWNNNLLLGGPALTTSSLLIDNLGLNSSTYSIRSVDTITLKEILLGNISALTNKANSEICTPVEALTFVTDTQITLIPYVENKCIRYFSQIFPLTVRLYNCLSVEDNIKYSERAVAASRSRSSFSTCLPSSHSFSSSSLEPSALLECNTKHQNESQPSTFSTSTWCTEDVTLEDIKMTIFTSPPVKQIEHIFAEHNFEEFYADKLLNVYSLLKETILHQKEKELLLPPPSALRRKRNSGNGINATYANKLEHSRIVDIKENNASNTVTDAANVTNCGNERSYDINVDAYQSVLHVNLIQHLKIICALTFGRMSLFGSQVSYVDDKLAEEVWQTYQSYLSVVANFTDITENSSTEMHKNSCCLLANNGKVFEKNMTYEECKERRIDSKYESCIYPAYMVCNKDKCNSSNAIERVTLSSNNCNQQIASSHFLRNKKNEQLLVRGSGYKSQYFRGVCNRKRCRGKKAYIEHFLETLNCMCERCTYLTTSYLLEVYEKLGGKEVFGDNFSCLIDKLQYAGLIIHKSEG